MRHGMMRLTVALALLRAEAGYGASQALRGLGSTLGSSPPKVAEAMDLARHKAEARAVGDGQARLFDVQPKANGER